MATSQMKTVRRKAMMDLLQKLETLMILLMKPLIATEVNIDLLILFMLGVISFENFSFQSYQNKNL
jgi:hypothetical protein